MNTRQQELLDRLTKEISSNWDWNNETLLRKKAFEGVICGKCPFDYEDIKNKIDRNRRIILNNSSKELFDFLELVLDLKKGLHSYGKFIKRFFVDVNIMGYVIQISYERSPVSLNVFANTLNTIYMALYQMFYAIVNQRDIMTYHSDVQLEFGIKHKLQFYKSY